MRTRRGVLIEEMGQTWLADPNADGYEARTLLKNPPILISDEAISALDSANARAIQAELQGVARMLICWLSMAVTPGCGPCSRLASERVAVTMGQRIVQACAVSLRPAPGRALPPIMDTPAGIFPVKGCAEAVWNGTEVFGLACSQWR